MKQVAVYPGRFHPFHKGHAASYNQLAQNFGKNNTYLAISKKQEAPNSPFTAGERAQMAMATGIPKENIMSVANTYNGTEYIERFKAAGLDPDNTILILAVSGKDMDGSDPRFSFKPKKDGSPSYLQPYTDGKLSPMTKHAYIMTTDVADFDINGEPVRDASTLRKMYKDADEQGKLNLLTQMYGAKAAKIFKPIFDERLTQTLNELFNKVKSLITNATNEQKQKFAQMLEAANAAQQAAIAISMKKAGKKPKKTVSETVDYLPEK